MFEIPETLRKRDGLIKRLLKSLRKFPIERQYNIICSWIDLEQLEKMVKAQEEQDNA